MDHHQDEAPLRPDRRSIAQQWAQNVLKDDTVTKTQDKPYMEAVLTTAAMMEQPVKSLAVAINDNGDHYKITLKGYKLLMSDEIWYTTFSGPNRDELLDNVKGTFTQHTDVGVIKVIHMNKVQFQTPAPSYHRSSIGLGGRGGGGGIVKEEEGHSLSSRRFRKRE